MNNIYEKTILASYNAVNGMINQLESVIISKARGSFYDTSSVEAQANKIIELTLIRNSLIVLKEGVDKALSKLCEDDIMLIKFKYFHVIPKIENFDHTSRNYFRKQIRALKRFSVELIKAGITQEFFINNYIKIAFIKEIYKRAIKSNGKKFSDGYSSK